MRLRTSGSENSFLQSFLRETGGLAIFSGAFFARWWRAPREWKALFDQMDEAGTRSFMLTAITGFAIGVVLAMQSRASLERFGAEAAMPSMLALSIFKELGPLLTSLVLAGRLGAGISAELGSMRVTEQIDALEVGALKPFNYLVVTRVLACIIVFPILTIWTDLIALSGGYLESVLSENMDYRLFIGTAFSNLSLSDVIVNTMKTSIFGFIVGMVSCYLGYNVRGGTREVGQAAMRAVVVSSLLIFLSNVIIVRMTLLL
ncbi:MAG: ABC transporter permease [Rhodothermales bacterium]